MTTRFVDRPVPSKKDGTRTDMSLWTRFLEHAEKDPEATAAVGTRRLPYGELAALARGLAQRLAPHCGPGDVAALRLPTEERALVAMLAVRSLGAAFLPVDLTAAEVRQQYVMRESGARVVIDPAPQDPAEVVVRPLASGRAGAMPPETAYLIFTSGSTGDPKGVLVPDSALVDRLDALARVPGASAETVFLALTPTSFDISLAELFLPLAVGGTVAFAPPEARYDAAVFAAAVERLRPSVLQGTPSFWHLMLDTGWPGASDAVVWSGGEAIGVDLARRLRARCAELWNLYGPTEAVIWAAAWKVDGSEPIILGDALPGSECVLIDARERILTAPGSEGEIVLGGAGLASGYLDGQRADRFAPLPGRPEAAWYRSGDRGRYLAHGALEFIGRNDAQVKYRGHRIELGDIEANLERHPGVGQAVAALCHAADPYRASLRAAVRAAPGANPDPADLRTWLAGRLTPAMVPQSVTVLPALPRNSSGKLDRPAIKALLEETR
jgi:amino acid adenylation domain-containing protein